MGRCSSIVVAALAAAMAAAGRGAPAEPAELAAQRARGAVAVEPADGRLGGATAVRAGGPVRELSPGGRLDLRPRADAPRRDGVGAGAAYPAAPAGSLPAMTDATLCLLNGERADHGLAPLRPDARLAAAATAYAADLVAGSYFSHTGRDGSGVRERIARSGYLPSGVGWVLGENLAWGTGAPAAPAAIVQGWMNSPGHRENILDPAYREVGIGVVAGNPAAADGLGATYATELGAIEGEQAAAAKRPAARRAGKPRKRARRGPKARHARRSAPRRGTARGRVVARIAM